MSFTVTATMPTNDGVSALKVFVLNNAIEAGGAQVPGNNTTGTWSLTPNFSNSFIAFVIYDTAGTGVWSAASNNTLVDNIAPISGGDTYADGWYSGTVTASTPVTVGATGGTDSRVFASYEVKPSGGSTPTIDASTPAVATNNNTNAFITSAAFTPPAGSVLVAVFASDFTSGSSVTGAASVTDTSGLGLTWTQRSVENLGSFSAVWVFTATVSGGGGTPFVPIAAARRTAARTPALPPVRRYRQMLPVPAQLNPPYPHRELVQRRQAWPRAMVRHSHVTIVVPAQLNPPYPFTEVRQWRQPRGFWPRRGHQFTPVPAQQAAAPNPAITFQSAKHLRMVYLRRGRQVMPVPAQQTPPTAVFVPQGQRHARIMAAPRHGRVTGPLLTQGEAPPRQRQPVRPRPSLPRRRHPAEVVPAQVTVAAPAWVQGHRSPLRAVALIRRRFRQLMPWPQSVASAFSVGTLTASDKALATLTATQAVTGTLATATAPAATLSAADATLATLTAADKRTGGPS